MLVLFARSHHAARYAQAKWYRGPVHRFMAGPRLPQLNIPITRPTTIASCIPYRSRRSCEAQFVSFEAEPNSTQILLHPGPLSLLCRGHLLLRHIKPSR